jgi:hypothetical protein
VSRVTFFNRNISIVDYRARTALWGSWHAAAPHFSLHRVELYNTQQNKSHGSRNVTLTTNIKAWRKTGRLVCINDELLVICIRNLNLHKLWLLQRLCMNCRHWATHSIAWPAMENHVSTSVKRTTKLYYFKNCAYIAILTKSLFHFHFKCELLEEVTHQVDSINLILAGAHTSVEGFHYFTQANVPHLRPWLFPSMSFPIPYSFILLLFNFKQHDLLMLLNEICINHKQEKTKETLWP